MADIKTRTEAGVNWLTEHKIPFGAQVEAGFEWLDENAYWVFDAISGFIEALIDWILWVLQSPPPLAAVVVVTAAAYAIHRKIGFAAFVAVALLLVINQGYWEETTETLALVIAASVVCMAVGVPIGVYGAHHPRFFEGMRPVLDMMQTIPTFVYLIPALILFGLGMVPGLIATVIFAIPAPIRLTQLGVASTPTPLIEAGKAFGATERQLLWKIELPYALPQIMAGLTQTIMLSLSMVVIAGLVAAGGLGEVIVRALNRADIAMGFEAALCIVLIAIVLDRFFRTDALQGGNR
nr:choline ABC transporter permease subunit [Roseibium hamelinense]